MTTEIFSCRSCGQGFSSGRGFASDRFCSVRCRSWFDSGNPLPGEASNGRGPFRVVASGNPDEIGKPLALRHAETIGAHALADALGVDRKAVSMSGIVGRKVRISYRTTGRRWQIDMPGSKAKRIGCLASDGHGAWHFRRLPQPDEAEIIRRMIGLKPVESTSSPEATDHLRKKAVNAHVSH